MHPLDAQHKQTLQKINLRQWSINNIRGRKNEELLLVDPQQLPNQLMRQSLSIKR